MAPSCRSAPRKIAPGRTKAPAGRRGPSRGGTGSERNDVLRLRALRALGDLELHALVLVQRAVALGLDGRVVHEDVGAAAVLSDEAEALLSVEPLHRTLCHAVSSVGDVLQPTLCRPDVLSCVPTLELALTSGARKHRLRGRIRRPHDRSTQETLNCSGTSMPCATPRTRGVGQDLRLPQAPTARATASSTGSFPATSSSTRRPAAGSRRSRSSSAATTTATSSRGMSERPVAGPSRTRPVPGS